MIEKSTDQANILFKRENFTFFILDHKVKSLCTNFEFI